MPRERDFRQVDVFSSTPYRGNPVAVVLDAAEVSDADMQQLARWTNLSETTFLLPPTHADADYRLRIFTPGGELPFAGHPTLGSAHAWLESGGQPRVSGRIVQECTAGLVAIRISTDGLAFAAPPMRRTGAIDDADLATFSAGLGVTPEQVIAHQWVDNGPGWAVVQLATAAEVLALEPDLALMPDAMVGAIGAYPPGSPHAFELRTFAPGMGVVEDPVCGSMNASVGQWMTSTGAAPSTYRVSQGARLERSGTINIVLDDHGQVWVGGHCTTCISGFVTL